jgi:hypothetical protein
MAKNEDVRQSRARGWENVSRIHRPTDDAHHRECTETSANAGNERGRIIGSLSEINDSYSVRPLVK